MFAMTLFKDEEHIPEQKKSAANASLDEVCKAHNLEINLLNPKEIKCADDFLSSRSLSTYSSIVEKSLDSTKVFALLARKSDQIVGCVLVDDECVESIGSTLSGVGGLLMLSMAKELEKRSKTSFYLYAAKREGKEDQAKKFYDSLGLFELNESQRLGIVPMSEEQQILIQSHKKLASNDPKFANLVSRI